jgi:hypothetical protein
VQQGLQKALEGKPKKSTSMKDEVWEDMDARALSTIHLCLRDEVFLNITGEETTTFLGNGPERLYMKKSLTNIIFLKKKFYNLRMKEGT